MKKFLIFLIILTSVGAYLYYVRGWDFKFDRDKINKIVFVDVTPLEEGSKSALGWKTVKPMLTQRSEIGAAIIKGKIYVVGGIDAYARTLRSVEIYDIENDEWSYGPPMPQALHHPAVTTDGEKLYVIGGMVGITFKPVDQAFEFDPVSNRWTELPKLNDFRGAATASVTGGRLLVVGGKDLAGPTGTMEQYDAENSRWETVATMPTPREHLASATDGGNLYVVGGRTHFPDGNLDAFESYDPNTGKWSVLEPIPTARGGIAAVEYDGKIYVFGGERPGGTIGQVEAYDTRKGLWIQFGVMPTPRHGLAAVADGNKIYVLGGGKRVGFSVSNIVEVLTVD